MPNFPATHRPCDPHHRSRARVCLALMLILLAPTAQAATNLCLRITINDQPAGSETRLRLSSPGQPTLNARHANGIARIAPPTTGPWQLTLRHPQMKPYRLKIPLDRLMALHLDCGHADEWSGCQPKPLSGGC